MTVELLIETFTLKILIEEGKKSKMEMKKAETQSFKCRTKKLQIILENF